MANAFSIPLSMSDFASYTTDDVTGRFFSHYPGGNLPITALTNMFKGKPVNTAQITFYEDYWQKPQTTTRGTNPLTTDAPSTGDADDGSAASGAIATTSALYLKVATVKHFREGQVIQAGAQYQPFYIADDVTKGVADSGLKGYVKVYPMRAFTFSAADYAEGETAMVTGSAVSSSFNLSSINPVSFRIPYARTNYRQVLFTPMQCSKLDSKEPQKMMKEGFFLELQRQSLIQAATEIEYNLLFGKRAKINAPDPTTAASQVDYNMSGIIEELEIWDAGSTGISINDGTTYAPYSWRTAATSDTDDDKRIISNAGGTISYKTLMTYLERLARYRDKNSSTDILCVVGSKAMIPLIEMFRKETRFGVTSDTDVYGLTLTKLLTPFGSLYFQSHPLFNDDPRYQNWMLLLDLPNIMTRYQDGHKLAFQPNMNNNEPLVHKSGWLTAMTLEMRNVRSNMLIKNVRNYISE